MTGEGRRTVGTVEQAHFGMEKELAGKLVHLIALVDDGQPDLRGAVQADFGRLETKLLRGVRMS